MRDGGTRDVIGVTHVPDDLREPKEEEKKKKFRLDVMSQSGSGISF